MGWYTEQADVRRTQRTIETIEIDLSNKNVDPSSEVEVILNTPDGRAHKVRVNTAWFIPAMFDNQF